MVKVGRTADRLNEPWRFSSVTLKCLIIIKKELRSKESDQIWKLTVAVQRAREATRIEVKSFCAKVDQWQGGQ